MAINTNSIGPAGGGGGGGVVAGCMATGLVDGLGHETASTQLPTARFGEVVNRDVREMYDRGLQYLAKTQTEKGDLAGGPAGPRRHRHGPDGLPRLGRGPQFRAL